MRDFQSGDMKRVFRCHKKRVSALQFTLTASFWPDVTNAEYREGLTVEAKSQDDQTKP